METTTNVGKLYFGMTETQVVELAGQLSRQTDENHPREAGSKKGFLGMLRAGSKALAAQPGYCKRAAV
jgi:hypothetical protein